MKFKVILEEGHEGGFKATIPSMPGCCRWGRNEEEAFQNLQHSILYHFGIEEVVHPRRTHKNRLLSPMRVSL